MNKIKFVEPEIDIIHLGSNNVLTDSWSSPVLPPTTNGLSDNPLDMHMY